MGEIEEVWFGGDGSVFLGLLHEPNSYALPSGQWTLVAPHAHGEYLVPKISIIKEFLCYG